jgi:DNA-3-methyladenine glycosylase I
MHKREAYREAFHDFKIDACAEMTDEELEEQRSNPGIIRNRNKIYSVRKNAQVVKKIQEEFGSFDAYLWSFTNEQQIDGRWETPAQIPTESEVSRKMAADMKKRGISFVGPVITYSFLQSIGIVNDHLADCEFR